MTKPLMIDEEPCECGAPVERDHVIEDMVMLKCTKCEKEYIKHLWDVSDDCWEWIKAYYRATHED